MLVSRAPSHACRAVSPRTCQQLQPLQRSHVSAPSRHAACRSSTKQSCSAPAQPGISAVPASPPQLVKSAAATLAAAALLLSPMGVPTPPAFAAGEDITPNTSSSSIWGAPRDTAAFGDLPRVTQVGEGQAGDAQHSSNPGWPMPSPMPHPPASPPQTPSPGGPQKPSLPPGPPDLLPRQPPTPSPLPGPKGPDTQTPTPKPELPQLPDVPPQLLPPCNPNPEPPMLLPPCPDTPPPVRPMGGQTQAGHTTQSSSIGSSGSRVGEPGAGGVADGISSKNSGVEVGVIGPVHAAGSGATHLADTALLAPPLVGADAGVAPAAAIDAAFDAALAPAGAASTAALAPSPVPSAKLDSSNMSINLDGRVSPTGKTAAGTATPSSKGSTGTSDAKASSKASNVVGGTGNAGTLNAFADWQPGSITVQQVLTEAGKLGLQLLEVVVRIAVFVIKYTLKAFIWLVKAIGQAVQAST